MQKLKKGQANVAIEMLVIILFVLVVLYPIAQTITGAGTTLKLVTNETIYPSINANGTINLTAFSPIDSIVSVRNISALITTPANYTYNSTTIYWVTNVSAGSSAWNVTYYYQPTGYDTNASNRVLLTVITTIILVVGVMLLIAKINV